MSRWVLQGIKFYKNVSHAPSLQEAHLGIIIFLSSHIKKGREKYRPLPKIISKLYNSHSSVLTLTFCCFGFELSVSQHGWFSKPVGYL